MFYLKLQCRHLNDYKCNNYYNMIFNESAVIIISYNCSYLFLIDTKYFFIVVLVEINNKGDQASEA